MWCQAFHIASRYRLSFYDSHVAAAAAAAAAAVPRRRPPCPSPAERSVAEPQGPVLLRGQAAPCRCCCWMLTRESHRSHSSSPKWPAGTMLPRPSNHPTPPLRPYPKPPLSQATPLSPSAAPPPLPHGSHPPSIVDRASSLPVASQKQAAGNDAAAAAPAPRHTSWRSGCTAMAAMVPAGSRRMTSPHAAPCHHNSNLTSSHCRPSCWLT